MLIILIVLSQSGCCRRGDACPFAHGVFECWLHPSRYRTQVILIILRFEFCIHDIFLFDVKGLIFGGTEHFCIITLHTLEYSRSPVSGKVVEE